MLVCQLTSIDNLRTLGHWAVYRIIRYWPGSITEIGTLVKSVFLWWNILDGDWEVRFLHLGL